MIHLQSVPGLPPGPGAGSAPGNGAMPGGPGHGAAAAAQREQVWVACNTISLLTSLPARHHACSQFGQRFPDFWTINRAEDEWPRALPGVISHPRRHSPERDPAEKAPGEGSPLGSATADRAVLPDRLLLAGTASEEKFNPIF